MLDQPENNLPICKQKPYVHLPDNSHTDQKYVLFCEYMKTTTTNQKLGQRKQSAEM